MALEYYLPIVFILGFLSAFVFLNFALRYRRLIIMRLDEKTIQLKIPLLSNVDLSEREYEGFFVKTFSDTLEKVKKFQSMLDVQTMIDYARKFNINYIGTEGDMGGLWSDGRLAFCTPSRGYSGGYNVHINPDLDRESVSNRLSEQLGVCICSEDLYTFLFLHEVGHTQNAGNENYFAALVNHSLQGGRRSVRRRRALKSIRIEAERFADRFALHELSKLRRQDRVAADRQI
jgi:hypothetical protein